MGNTCPNDCSLGCCLLSGVCAPLQAYCFYYYYDWTWVYWTVGVIITLLIIGTIVELIYQKRQYRIAMSSSKQPIQVTQNNEPVIIRTKLYQNNCITEHCEKESVENNSNNFIRVTKLKPRGATILNYHN